MWALPRALRGESAANAEYTLRRKDTGETWVGSYSFAPIRDKDGAIVGSVVVARDITDHKRAEEELRRSRDELEIRVQERTADLEGANEALRHLSSRLLSAQEDERKRIAGELHDTIGSCLSGVKYKIEDFVKQIENDSSVTPESIRSVIPVIQEGIEECRRMQQDLRPSMLDDLGLLPTLSWFCRRYETIYTRIKVELEQCLEERDIPNSLKIVIFRITQEGMNNIAKHSKADRVHLSLRKKNGGIELFLEDNGRGFDLNKVVDSESTKRGLGLTSMRERIEHSGGQFAIDSTVGKGTIVRAVWSLGGIG
jgi:signal transduction histidine kinase